MRTPILIQTDALTKKYGNGTGVIALQDVSLSVVRGEFVAIRGPSGSGKSTLLNLLGTLDRPTTGRIVIDGVDVSTLNGNELADFRRENIGFVFQLFNLVPELTALDNVMMPLLPYQRGLKFKLLPRARELLESLGLGARLNHLPGQLSGGEQQRVAIARALVNQPRLILADEPTGNLDSHSSREVNALLQQLNKKEGITLVLATHDAAVAVEAGQVLQMRDGRVAE